MRLQVFAGFDEETVSILATLGELLREFYTACSTLVDGSIKWSAHRTKQCDIIVDIRGTVKLKMKINGDRTGSSRGQTIFHKILAKYHGSYINKLSIKSSFDVLSRII